MPNKKQSFTITATVNGVTSRSKSISISQSFGQVYPSLSLVMTDPESMFIAGANVGMPKITVRVTATGTGKDIVNVDGYIVRVSNSEDIVSQTCNIIVSPVISLLDYMIGYVDLTGNSLCTVSAKALMAGILAKYNTEITALPGDSNLTVSPSIDFAVTDYMPMSAPRFINMSYGEMLRKVAGERGLVMSIGFDKILHILSYQNCGSSNISINLSQLSQSTVSTDILAANSALLGV